MVNCASSSEVRVTRGPSPIAAEPTSSSSLTQQQLHVNSIASQRRDGHAQQVQESVNTSRRDVCTVQQN